MKTKIDNGGSAFPRTGYYPPTTPGMDIESLRERMPAMTEPADGMDLRDYFAAKAMQSIFTGPGAAMVAARDERYDETNWAQIVASNAYEMADAMIAERNKR